jgi:hypothetical protein
MALHETAVLSFDSEVSTFLCVQKRWGSELPVIVGHGSLFFSYFYEARIIPVKFLSENSETKGKVPIKQHF